LQEGEPGSDDPIDVGRGERLLKSEEGLEEVLHAVTDLKKALNRRSALN
jgi:hypothetical protein